MLRPPKDFACLAELSSRMLRRNALLVAAVVAAVTPLAFAGGAIAERSNSPKKDQFRAPPQPGVKPVIRHPAEADRDGDKIDDQLKLVGGQRVKEKPGALVRVELIFDRQVDAEDLRAFVKLGGRIRHVFRAISYGFTGRIAPDLVERLPGLYGAKLVAVMGERKVKLHMLDATRNGRVRPVWVPGFAGSTTGVVGSSNITIGIIDTGVDGTHPDLKDNCAYWRDYSSSNESKPLDYGGHGSHVAGIAVGSGATAGVSPTQLKYTDSGNYKGGSGGFTGSPIHLAHGQSSSITLTAYWNDGGSGDLLFVYRSDGSTGNYSYRGAPDRATGTSPLSLTTSFTANGGRHYSSALLANGTIKHYAIANTVTYAGAGDGFNAVSGVAPGCRWAGAKVFANDAESASTLDIAEALDDLTARRQVYNVKIVNMSLGGSVSTAFRNKVNSVVNNGIIAVTSAGNDGPTGEITDPGRAELALTVASANRDNQLTQYSSIGNSGWTERKPDLMAPGGSSYYGYIVSVDSNSADADLSTFGDKQADDYAAYKGTSMASPFAAGAAALVIDALEQAGLVWDFSSNADALKVKMLLCATATESNQNREVSSGSNPTLGRATTPKDDYEGYGMLNPDAAIECTLQSFTSGSFTGSTAGGRFDRRAWGRNVTMVSGRAFGLSLTVPSTADLDLYLYSATPGTNGNPTILASSTNSGNGTDESISYTPTSSGLAYLVVKRVSGNGSWTLAEPDPSDTWDAGGSDTNWSTQNNWKGNSVPSSGASVYFASGGSAANLDGNRTVNSLTFDRDADLSIGGSSTLTVNSAITVDGGQSAARTYSVSTPVTLGGANTWTVNNRESTTANSLVASGAVNNGGNKLTVAGAGNSKLSGGSSGAGALAKQGAGTLVLSGTHAYTGATTVDAGVLLVDGSLNTQTEAVTVNGAGTLGGVGTINRPVNVLGGTVSPGGESDSLATLTVNGDYAQYVDSVLAIALGGTSTSDYDRLAVSGKATLNGKLTVTLDGFTPASGNSFTILTYGSRSDNVFTEIELPSLSGGLYWVADHGSTSLTLTVSSSTLSISGVTILTPSDPNKVGKYEKLEFRVNLNNLAAQTRFYEPDPARDGLDLTATFYRPSAPTTPYRTVPAFYDGQRWLVRFAPDEVNASTAWTFEVEAEDRNGTATKWTGGSFKCVDSAHPGWVRINGRYLAFSDSGLPFFGVGHNNGWQYDLEQPSFASMSARGENLLSFWCSAPWRLASKSDEANRAPIENAEQGIGNYNQSACAYLDGIVDRAADADVYLMPSIWSHGELRDSIGHTWGAGWWENSAYSRIGIGAADFFHTTGRGSDTDQWRYQKNFFRYLLARWGYSRAIMGWVIVVEMEGTTGYDENATQADTWCTEVRDYFATYDLNRKNGSGVVPLSTFKSDNTSYDPGLGIRAVDTYADDGRGGSVDNYQIADRIASHTLTMRGTSKPCFHGEFGANMNYSWSSQPTHLHNGVWGGTAAGAAIIPQLYCDGNTSDSYYFPLLTHGTWGASMRRHLEILREFMDGIDYRCDTNLVSAAFSVQSGNARGWYSTLSNRGFGWIQDTNGSSFNGTETLRVTGMTSGSYRVRWFNVWSTGLAPFQTTTVSVSGSNLDLVVPSASLPDVAVRFDLVSTLKVWTGSSGTSWNGSGNWSPSGPPGSSDAVLIPGSLSNYPTLDVSSTIKNLTLDSGATLNLTSGSSYTLTVSDNAILNGTVNQSAAALSVGGDRVYVNGSYTHNGAVSLSASGATLTVTNGNTYAMSASGATATALSIIADGTVRVDGTAGDVQVTDGGTLQGNGTVGAVIAYSGGTVAPGTSIGGLSASSADFSDGGTLAIEVGGGTATEDASQAGTGHDWLEVTGTLTLGGQSTLTVSGLSSDRYATKVASWGSVSGSGFTNVPSAPVSVRYDTTNKWVNLGNGVVPTPVTITSFTARSESEGVLLLWDCESEYENAGFHLWRRAVGSSDEAWRRATNRLIPGRITNPTAKRYAWLDDASTGRCEYRLESVSIDGASGFHCDLARPVLVADLAVVGRGANSKLLKAAIAERIQAQSRASRAIELSNAIARRAIVGTGRIRDLRCELYAPRRTARRLWSRPRRSVDEAVKVVTDVRGLVRIPAAQLPSSYSPRRLSIQYEGRTLRALAADRDGVLLWAPGYEDEYTDKDAFFLRPSRRKTAPRKPKKARWLFRPGMAPATSHVAQAELDFHDVYYRWDRSLMPYAYPPWFSDKYLSAESEGTLHAFTLSARDVVSGDAELMVRLWSHSSIADESPDHVLQVFVNGTSAGQATWDGGGRMLELTFTVPSGVVVDGENKIELLTPPLASGKRVFSFLHGLKLSYPQGLVGGKPIEISAARGGVYEVSRVPSKKAWVVDVSDSRRARLVPYATRRSKSKDGTYVLRFRTRSGSRSRPARYYVAPIGTERSALSVSLRELRALSPGYRYLAVGPESLGAAVHPLLVARSDEGLTAAFAAQENVFDVYGFGRYGPGGILGAVRTVKPEYLLLLGRTTYDYRGYEDSGVDPMCPTILTATTKFGLVNGDALYGDLGKGYPEVAVGRLPAYDSNEVSAAVARILAYTSTPSGGSGVLLADKLDPDAGDFASETDALGTAVPEVSWMKVQQGIAAHQTAPAARTGLLSEINSGAEIVLYAGHGSSSRIGRDNILDGTSASGWDGNAVMLLASCNGIYLGANRAGYRTLSHALIAKTGGGSPCVIGSSTYLNSATHVEFMQRVLVEARLPGMRWGDALTAAQRWAYETAAGEDGIHLDLVRAEGLLGDPALPVVSTGRARADSVTDGDDF